MGKKQKKNKPQRPQRDEFELEELALNLVEAYEEKSEVVLHIFQSETIQGRVIKLDGNTKLVHVEEAYEVKKVPFMNILKLSNPA